MLKFYKKKPFFFLVFMLWGLASVAQVRITPLINSKSYQSNKKNFNKRILETPLLLPFFDDFSTIRDGVKDTLLWEPEGGTLLNNSIALNPPTYNTITFDGLDETGKPYNEFGSPLKTGNADSLTSLPIDLSLYNQDSAVYLSFLWQAEGLGEEPDYSNNDADSLSLFFLAKDNVWYSVWSARGASVQNFKNAIVPINDSIYFWTGFQFRLISHGNLSGGFDNWNVDYFYLNSHRNSADTLYEDMAISKRPTSFLRRYSSMPYSQYLKNPSLETADYTQLAVFFQNATPRIPNPTLEIFKDNTLVYSLLKNRNVFPYVPDTFNFNINYKQVIGSDSLLTDNNIKKSLKMRFDLVSKDNIPRNQRNDTLTVPVVFDDYYAYDDGSAEAAFTVTGLSSRIAYKYSLNKPAKITAIDIYFAPQIKDMSGTSLKLKIWKRINDGTQEDSVYKTLGTVAQYSSEINKFIRYPIDTADQVVLSDDFYIGFEQGSIDPLPIGFDRNTASNEQIYYQLAGDKFVQYTDVPGSLMIRPVFELSDSMLVGDNDPVRIKPYKVYPNPSFGSIFIKGEINQATLYDYLGNIITSKSFKFGEEKEINIQNLKNGIYILHLFKGKEKLVEKIILQK